MKTTKCKGGCGAKTTGCSRYCPQCKGKIARGANRARRDGILVDFAGGAAWAWDRIGNVIAGPAESKGPIWIGLAE